MMHVKKPKDGCQMRKELASVVKSTKFLKSKRAREYTSKRLQSPEEILDNSYYYYYYYY
jgi:hypothetical protein